MTMASAERTNSINKYPREEEKKEEYQQQQLVQVVVLLCYCRKPTSPIKFIEQPNTLLVQQTELFMNEINDVLFQTPPHHLIIADDSNYLRRRLLKAMEPTSEGLDRLQLTYQAKLSYAMVDPFFSAVLR